MNKFKIGDLVKIVSNQRSEKYSEEYNDLIKKIILSGAIFKIKSYIRGMPFYYLDHFLFIVAGEDLTLADFDDGGL